MGRGGENARQFVYDFFYIFFLRVFIVLEFAEVAELADVTDCNKNKPTDRTFIVYTIKN